MIIKPRITEKAGFVNTQNVYTFEIGSETNKKEVAKEIARLYKVHPMKVNITRNPGKNVMYKGKVGRTTGVKKAYVYLKQGEKIDL